MARGRAVTGVLVAVCLALLLSGCGSPATAVSEGCGNGPSALSPVNGTAAETKEIDKLWSQFGVAPAGGGGVESRALGPLGCAIETPGDLSPLASDYARQRFQRGWILIRRGNGSPASASVPEPQDVVIVRGLGEWFAWWQGSAKIGLYDASSGGPAASATMGRPTADGPQGFWATIAGSDTARLVACDQPSQCPGPPKLASIGLLVPPGPALTPDLGATDVDGSAGPPIFDVARLGLNALTDPDPSKATDRINAALAPWLPCYTSLPTTVIAGEDAMAHALVLLRRNSSCPITNDNPARSAEGWLAGNDLQHGALPGTTTDPQTFLNICGRVGDLDMTLAGLIHVVHRFGSELNAATVDHLLAIMSPWGGTARGTPDVQPDGSCLGYPVLETENHILLQESERYLIDELLTEHPTVAPIVPSDTSTNGTDNYVRRLLRLYLRRDFYEFNALPYTRMDLKALYLLNDYAADPVIRSEAAGVLDWMYAKFAVASDLARDMRPYRRRPEEQFYDAASWFGGSNDALTPQAALLEGGGLQYALDPAPLIDAQNPKDVHNTDDFKNRNFYPALGSLPEGDDAEITDVADTTYRPPDQVSSWYSKRYDPSNVNVSYLQAVHHRESPGNPLADEDQFLQSNDGAELYSGTRAWLMTAGGMSAPAGQPVHTTAARSPTSLLGALQDELYNEVKAKLGVVPGGKAAAEVLALFLFPKQVVDAFANAKEHDTLAEDQNAIMRPTSFIATSSTVSPAQSLRFESATNDQLGNGLVADRIQPRMCVAEGFMCGFDVMMPAHMLDKQDQCPVDNTADSFDGDQRAAQLWQSAHDELGCLMAKPEPKPGGWMVWTFDGGDIAVNTADPPTDRSVALVYEGPNLGGQPDEPSDTVYVTWHIHDHQYDWWDIHGYPGAKHDGGALEILGNTDGSSQATSTGTVTFPPKDIGQRAQMSINIEGCDYKKSIGEKHQCVDTLFPDLPVSSAPRPRKAFACASHPTDVDGAVVYEVGTCPDHGYGFYLYLDRQPCMVSNSGGDLVNVCGGDHANYDFAIAAPADGFKDPSTGAESYTPFRDMIQQWLVSHRPDTPDKQTVATALVPLRLNEKHYVRFQWVVPNYHTWQIVSDSGAADQTVSALGRNIDAWPLASGNITSPTNLAASIGSPISAPNDQGCFIVDPAPGSAVSTPLRVDLADPNNPQIGPTNDGC